jgi:adenine-specific DNA-methyltransferase
LLGYRNTKILNKSFTIPKRENIYNNPDSDERGNYKQGVISKTETASNVKHKYYYTVSSPSGNKITRQFEISKEKFLRLDEENRIYWGTHGNCIPSIKILAN